MFKKLLSFAKKKEVKETFITIQLNDKIMPLDRGEHYEEPIEEYLEKHNYGEVSGGGTMQGQSGEIQFCDIEVLLYNKNDKPKVIGELINMLEHLGAPKGSRVITADSEETIAFGRKEGLAIYLDGINLPEPVYAECDSNFVLEELSKLVGYDGEVQRYWQGDTETALYFYGDSFENMKTAISEFISTYPLCQNARVVQIA